MFTESLGKRLRKTLLAKRGSHPNDYKQARGNSTNRRAGSNCKRLILANVRGVQNAMITIAKCDNPCADAVTEKTMCVILATGKQFLATQSKTVLR